MSYSFIALKSPLLPCNERLERAIRKRCHMIRQLDFGLHSSTQQTVFMSLQVSDKVLERLCQFPFWPSAWAHIIFSCCKLSSTMTTLCVFYTVINSRWKMITAVKVIYSEECTIHLSGWWWMGSSWVCGRLNISMRWISVRFTEKQCNLCHFFMRRWTAYYSLRKSLITRCHTWIRSSSCLSKGLCPTPSSFCSSRLYKRKLTILLDQLCSTVWYISSLLAPWLPMLNPLWLSFSSLTATCCTTCGPRD